MESVDTEGQSPVISPDAPWEVFGISDLSGKSRELEKSSAEDRVSWALEHFGDRVALSSSFGAQSAVMLHMVSQLSREIPVILVDTGYLFEETYRFVDDLVEKLDLNLQVYRSSLSPAWQEAKFGRLWEQGLEGIEQYNRMNKVEPMDRALEELGIDAWITGIRRQQSETREKMSVLALKKGRVRVHPIIDWTDMDIGKYLEKHDLPYHPLWEQGYISIGDWHTSHRLTDGMSEQDARFFGLKRECGLHEDVDFVI